MACIGLMFTKLGKTKSAWSKRGLSLKTRLWVHRYLTEAELKTNADLRDRRLRVQNFSLFVVVTR